MTKNCKSHSCDDPEHEHQFPDMKEMKKNLDSQMQGDTVEKALRAATVESLGREARFTLRAAAIGTREVRHFGESTPAVTVVTPIVPTVAESTTYESCGGCGVVYKSLQTCPRCDVADSITEVRDWRTQ